MKTYQTIDFHTHAFPDAIAKRAMEKLSREGGGLPAWTDGTVGGLERVLKENDAAGVLLPVATNPAKLCSMNTWAAAQQSDRIISFGAVHPFAPDAVEQLDYICSLGMKGVKLHPEYQGFQVDDPKARALYREIGKRRLITVFHAGLDMAYLPPCACAPDALARVMADFDGAPVVAAHMGGYMLWESALQALRDTPVFLDTSYVCGRIVRPLAQRMAYAFGAERILFGTDLPWSGFADTRRMIASWDLSPQEQSMILYGNAQRLLGFE